MIFTKDNFEKEVLKSEKPVLVDFFAVWCGPCQMAGPVLEKLAKEYEGKVKIGKVDIDESRELAGEQQVMSVPTFVFFKGGKEVRRLVGFPGEAGLKQELENLLKSN